MANYPTIPGGPGNNKAKYSDLRPYRCGEAITKGQAVAFIDGTAMAALIAAYPAADYTYGTVIAPADLDANNPSLGFSIGIACESGSAGQWIDVCVAGLCPVAVITDGNVLEGDVLIPTSTAGTVGNVAGETQSVYGFAIALSDDSSTSLAANRCIVMRRV